ncbi:MAG TPA: hypothetical protein PKD83_10955 [Ignavibacteria bacterium]|nr:hypothetical protein [Ignavibacteria bacterium]
MKKLFALLFLLSFSIPVGFAQQSNVDLDNSIKDNTNTSNVFDVNTGITQSKNIFPQLDQSSIEVLPADDGNSQNGRAPMGGRRYIRTVYLIKPSEMVSSGFGADLVTSIGWTYLTLNVQNPQNIATRCDNLTVYLMSTTDITNTRGPLGWTSAISGMTKVYSGQCALPSGLGPHFVDINMGGPGTLPFSTIAGQGVYVAFEYTNSIQPIALSQASPNITCNRLGLALGAYTGQSQTGHVNALTGSAFRAATRFGGSSKPVYVDVGSVSTLTSTGQAALCVCPNTNTITYSVDHLRTQADVLVVRVRVIDIMGGTIEHEWIDNVFTNLIETTQIIHVYGKSGDTKNNDSITVEIFPVAGENVLYNNRTNERNAYVKRSTLNSWNYTVPTDTIDGGFGLTGAAPARTAAIFNSQCNRELCAVDLIFNRLDLLNNKPYHIEIYDDAGGSPGVLMYNSGPLRVPITNLGRIHVSHIIQPSLNVIFGKYYVAVVQDSLVNLGLGFQWEAPMRTETFYYKNTTDPAWTDAGSIAAGGTFIFRPSIGVRTTLNLKLAAWLEGNYSNGTGNQYGDTITVIARNQNSPYLALDTVKANLADNGTIDLTFCGLYNDSCYIYQINNRNHIETWTHDVCEKIDECGEVFNLRNAASQAFAGNMAPVLGLFSAGASPTEYAIYTGDINQDGTVDASDLSQVENAVGIFDYIPEDVNNDLIVDASDIALVENNSLLSIFAVTPLTSP